MNRNAFLIFLILLPPTLSAQVIDDDILQGLTNFAVANSSDIKRNFDCLGEHVCVLGGGITWMQDCDSRVSSCLRQAIGAPHDKGESVSPDFHCGQLAKTLDTIHLERLRNPIGCEAKPPPQAFLPAITREEAQCITRAMCRKFGKRNPSICSSESFLKCSQPMDGWPVSERQSCRGSRSLFDSDLISGCPLSSRHPLSLRVAVETPEKVAPNTSPHPHTATSASTDTPPQTLPQTWQEQVEQIEKDGPPPQDEFDLGEFDAF
jgi:hypothetical protein